MSNDKEIRYSSSYQVGTEDVRLKVRIGDGQFGSSIVQVGDLLFPHERIFDQVIGRGSELVGKRLQVFSVVTDTNKQTNRTSVTYRLEGGPASLEHTLAFTVSNERDSVDYKAEIDFTQQA